MNSKHFSAPSRFGLGVLAVLVLLLVAYNFVGEWWLWEHRLTAAGFLVAPRAYWLGRLNLLRAGAVLCAALAAFEFLRTVPRPTRLVAAASLAALLLTALPWGLRYLIPN